MNILLADDQPQVRSALRLLLEQKTDAHIAGEAASFREVLLQAAATPPDTILIDWELPGLSRFDGMSSLRRACPSACIVALSSRPEARQAALHAGAHRFVCKGDPPERLLTALSGSTAPPRKKGSQ
jgi:DNA-binding NarL/FixJ family response regulator